MRKWAISSVGEEASCVLLSRDDADIDEPTAAERQAAIDEFNNNPSTAQARVLRLVAEHPTLVQREFNRAFVLMQYFGYLRRNPDDAPDNNLNGYNFWLGKLNQFNGDFVQAEMVKAFIQSGEYRHRFGQ